MPCIQIYLLVLSEICPIYPHPVWVIAIQSTDIRPFFILCHYYDVWCSSFQPQGHMATAQNYQPPKWMVFLLNMIISVGHWYHNFKPLPHDIPNISTSPRPGWAVRHMGVVMDAEMGTPFRTAWWSENGWDGDTMGWHPGKSAKNHR